MPDPTDYDTRDDWMEACVPTRIEEGDDQDQAVAVCSEIWRDHVGETKAVPVKAVQGEGGEWVLDVLGAPYGSVLDKDADGEWFDANTNFHADKFGMPPAVYYHGWDEEGRPKGSPSYIGKTIKRWVDSAGMWFRVVLDQAKAEAKRVWEAAQRNVARASTGTLPHLARVEQGGHIVEWPIGELSLLDAEGGRQPVNRHAIAVPAMKAVYDQAGLSWPDDIASESGGPEAEPEATSVAASAVTKARVQAELTLIDIMEV